MSLSETLTLLTKGVVFAANSMLVCELLNLEFHKVKLRSCASVVCIIYTRYKKGK